MTADIEKMYRQFVISQKDRDFQRILWRNNANEALKHFTLNTVTFGTASAPFLATRCLIKLADDNQENHPEACDVIRKNFYVDDLLTGADSIEKCKSIKEQVTSILKSSGLSLSKWASNNEDIAPQPEQEQMADFNFSESSHKTLGLFWKPRSDVFYFQFQLKPKFSPFTKRQFLSEISQIFDPLGLLTPLLITHNPHAKNLEATIKWHQHINKLNDTVPYEIPRCTVIYNSVDHQLHGFCDASEQAYVACIYLRSTNKLGQVKCQLLCSRSRVAPLKHVTIPRLELFALHWIKGDSYRWTTFVANRVSAIQDHSVPANWHHVGTAENPADLTSRGMDPDQLVTHKLWWNGPEWLRSKRSTWPHQTYQEPENVPEIKLKLLTNFTTSTINPWFRKWSNLSKLMRIIAYVKRPWRNKNLPCKETGIPSASELNDPENSADCSPTRTFRNRSGTTHKKSSNPQIEQNT
ncbi:uncharacterized protein LOC143918623 [Arctopsyche grandis]|uniref:uncharacterized protein LOC143918623 n=1 Tax=Arctopsyche grandis TaxID=121162 RepID=UPI00406D6728